MTKEKLNSLSEEDRYLVVGIEDGWIDPTNKDLERYYELTGVDTHPIRTWLKNLIKQIKGDLKWQYQKT